MPAARDVTPEQLGRILAQLRGSQFVTVIARTDARLKKRDNPYGAVQKVARVNGVIGWNYGLTVRRQQAREGREADFTPEPRSWGNRISPALALKPKLRTPRRRGLAPLITYKGKVYLEVKVERVLATRYFAAAGGCELTAEQVEPYLRKRKSAARHQGVRREVVLRDYLLASVESLVLAGLTYQVTPGKTPSP